jgi:hypothetical protein
LRFLIAACLVLALLFVAHAVVRGALRASVVAKVPGIVASIDELGARRWQRTVVSGVPHTGAPDVWAALEALKLPRLSSGVVTKELEDALLHGGLLPIRARDLADERTAELDGLLETTRYALSAPVSVDHALGLTKAHTAERLLLVRAVQTDAAGCLPIVADVIRLDQDMVAGSFMTLEWPFFANELAVAVGVAARCSALASAETLVSEEPRFAVLGRESPPLGKALAGTALLTTAMLAEWACTEPLFPTSFAHIAAAIQCPSMRRATSSWSRDPERWFDLESATVRATREAIASECASRDASIRFRTVDDHTLPLAYEQAIGQLSMIVESFDGAAVARGRTIAMVRALAVAMATLAKLPPGEDVIGDPFGDRLHVRLGSPVTVWSVGEDGRDDDGGGDDIVVHIP